MSDSESEQENEVFFRTAANQHSEEPYQENKTAPSSSKSSTPRLNKSVSNVEISNANTTDWMKMQSQIWCQCKTDVKCFTECYNTSSKFM